MCLLTTQRFSLIERHLGIIALEQVWPVGRMRDEVRYLVAQHQPFDNEMFVWESERGWHSVQLL